MALARSRRSQVTNYWPGFVDALSSLLLVIIFLLSLFMLTQFFLGQEISGKDTAMSRLNAQIAELTELLQLEKANSSDLDTTIATLQATLATTAADRDRMAAQLAGLGTGTDGKDAQIAQLQSDLQAKEDLSSEAAAQVALLNQQLAALRTQIGALEEALQASESKETESRTQIADLGRRLNLALAQRVQDLSRYRSDFFGKLRAVLENRSDVRIVGDRFVFQSEVLFPAGEATISDAGRTEMAKLAAVIKELTTQIPADVNWVLRIDGHTDKRPINTPEFPSNWELSAARAIAVTKYFVEQGIPAQHLVAAGFGDSRPIDTGDTEDAFARNRRIEFKLTDG
ncbi:MAG: peptidoglycan -binding protein [Devosia sp.]|uniref:peptidoglycan -binding protein n=1 Tax=Devosia sp. TaxID=1871048 RepID=UPI001AC90352|nr:peptidoglycan -binding protein [Devosia sp.]MBN9307728.1 peptidoglycan -binding protein [Devosia sp.]MBN9317111.1 peptidoglycan -binding protein [Devosia sp.]